MSTAIMDQKKDLRSIYKHEEAYGFIIADRLQTCLPPFTTAKRVGFSSKGLDCLLQVVRQYNSSQLARNKSGDVRHYEGENLILLYAWQDFWWDPMQPTEELMERVSREKKHVLETITSGESLPQLLSFLSLATSDIMNKTFWCQEQFHLYVPAVECKPGTPSKILHVSAEQSAKLSLLRMNCQENPTMSLQEFIEGSFGPRSVSESTFQLWSSNEPIWVRLHYTANAETPLPQIGLRTFDMPIAGYKGPEDSLVWHREVHRARYNLTAVVRLRQSDNDFDYVRTYRENGTYIEPHVKTKVIDDGWSLEDKGGQSYMLFFSWCPGVKFIRTATEVGSGISRMSQASSGQIAKTMNKFLPGTDDHQMSSPRSTSTTVYTTLERDRLR